MAVTVMRLGNSSLGLLTEWCLSLKKEPVERPAAGSWGAVLARGSRSISQAFALLPGAQFQAGLTNCTLPAPGISLSLHPTPSSVFPRSKGTGSTLVQMKKIVH